MFSHHLGARTRHSSERRSSLSACKTFSPDGGMSTVAEVAGGGLNKNVVRDQLRRGRCARAERGLAAAASAT